MTKTILLVEDNASDAVVRDGPATGPMDPLRVLLVDDSATDEKLLMLELKRMGRPVALERVETAPAMRAALDRATWDVVISDWSMPRFSGLAALEVLTTTGLDLPFIIVSGTVGEEPAVAAMRAGAHDYVTKGNLGRLGPAIEREMREHAVRVAHQRAEAGRREAELRFRRLFDSGISGVTVATVTGLVVEANDTFLDLVGYTHEDVAAGRVSWAAMTPTEWRGANLSVTEELKANGSGRPFEKEYLRKDGSRVAVLVGIALLDEQRVITVVTDLTERKNAEERKAAVVDAALDGVVGMDHGGFITEFNPAAERMFGYARREVLGRRLSEVIVPPRLRAAHTEGLERYLAGGEGPVLGRRVELSAVRSDGVEFPVELSVSRVGAGRTPSFVGFIRDTSEQKRVEGALVERMRVGALGSDVGMALTNGKALRDALERCCQAVVENLGASSARIWTLSASTQTLELRASAGRDLEAARSAAPLEATAIGRIAAERVACVSNDVPVDSCLAGDPWAGRAGTQAFAGHPLLVDGELVGVMATSARGPLSEVALAGLASIADAIAVRVRGKLAEDVNLLLEEQLRQSQKMEAIGRLAGGIAHDFNNVLSVVLSYSELVMGDLRQGDPSRDDVVEIHRAGERATALTRQLLMFSRQQVVQPRVLELNDLLSGMETMLRRLVGEDVELTCVLGSSLGRVKADLGSIEQVIMNLVVNARDAMPIGGKLTLETANTLLDEEYTRTHLGAKAGAYVMLSVTDTGGGMDRATQARIFEPFFTTKGPGQGTGLGLSTVFGIMQQSGGSVWVYSEPAIGTTFKLYLPRVDAVVDTSAPRRPSTMLRGSETILLVEDEQQVRDVARGILRRHGYTVLEARSGGEALLLCKDHEGTIDLLVSDVVMPGMSGAQLARQLAVTRPQMKVLCMSGYTDDAAVRHGVIDAAFAYLQKPLTVEGLTRKVREVLDGQRVAN